MSMIFALVLALALVPATPPEPHELKVVSVAASSTLPKWKGYTFDAANLIDGRVDTSWQPAKGDTMGVGEWVELDLGAPHEIAAIEIAQGLQKVDPKLGDLFCRNNRFAFGRLIFDDGTFAPYNAFAGDRVSTVELFYRGESRPGMEVTVVTRFIRLVIASVHEPVDWKDVAIAELRVFGRPAKARPVDATSIRWDQPGAYPLKAAVVEFCNAKAERRKQRDCATLVRVISEGRSVEDWDSPTLAPISVADLDKGEVVVSFDANRTHVRLELARNAGGRWSVSRLTRLDEAGKQAPPASEYLDEGDLQHQNACWEKLGKTRRCDATGEHIPDE